VGTSVWRRERACCLGRCVSDSVSSYGVLVAGDGGEGEGTHRTPGQLVILPIVILIVRHRAVPEHSHHIRKHHPRPPVLVSVDDDAQAIEIVFGAEHFSRLGALFGQPDRHAVPVEVAGAVNFKFDFHHPICGCHGHSGPEPSLLRLAVGGEAYVSVRRLSACGTCGRERGIFTDRLSLWCPLRIRNIDFACPSLGMAVSFFISFEGLPLHSYGY